MRSIITTPVALSILLTSHLGYSLGDGGQGQRSSGAPVASPTAPPTAPTPPSAPSQTEGSRTAETHPSTAAPEPSSPPPAHSAAVPQPSIALPVPSIAPPSSAGAESPPADITKPEGAPPAAAPPDAPSADAKVVNSQQVQAASPAEVVAPSVPIQPKPKPAKVASSTDDQAEEASEAAPASTLEDPEPSQGHFIALGVHGVGAMAFDDSRGKRTPTFGPGFSLRFGEALTDWLDLSLAFAFATTSGDVDDRMTFGRFGLQSQWYVTDRVFIQAGFGVTNGQGTDPEDHDFVRGRYGDVYLTGVGYNIYLSASDQSGGWVLTPVLTAEVGPDRMFTTAALSLGLEVSWWTGLTRDKLNLPLSKAYDKSSE